MSTTIEREPELIAAEHAMVKAADKGSLLPVFRGTEMAAALTAYRDLQKALDGAMPDQIMSISGKPFRKKGYWRAVARAFKLNIECTKEESDEFGWRVVYRATSPNGQFAEGDGACEYDEKADNMATEHNVRSHAHTRAFNRAISNLVGFGEVSAEEVAGTGRRPTAVVIPDPPDMSDRQPAPDGYHYIHGYQKQGEWHEFHLLKYRADGSSFKFSTKRDQIGEVVSQAFQNGVPIRVTDYTPKKNSAGEGYVNKVETYKPGVIDAAPISDERSPF